MRALEHSLPYFILFVSLLVTAVFSIFNAKVFTTVVFNETSNQTLSSTVTALLVMIVVASVIFLTIFEHRKGN